MRIASISDTKMSKNNAKANTNYSTFDNLDTNKSDKGKSTYTVDDAIEKIGFGKFQAFISVAIGSAWTAGK